MRGRRPQPGRSLHEPETLHPRHGHRVTLTAAPRAFPLQQRRALAFAKAPGLTGNVQLYLAEAGWTLTRMAARLVGFGAWVKARGLKQGRPIARRQRNRSRRPET
jgi:hypothetical protein